MNDEIEQHINEDKYPWKVKVTEIARNLPPDFFLSWAQIEELIEEMRRVTVPDEECGKSEEE